MRRPRFQFSMRQLLVAVALAAMAIACFADMASIPRPHRFGLRSSRDTLFVESLIGSTLLGAASGVLVRQPIRFAAIGLVTAYLVQIAIAMIEHPH